MWLLWFFNPRGDERKTLPQLVGTGIGLGRLGRAAPAEPTTKAWGDMGMATGWVWKPRVARLVT